MALNAKKRQKKLAKKASKRKAKSTKKNKGKGGVLSTARLIAIAANSPLHQCLVPKGLFDAGMGSVIVSRKMPEGDIGFSIFLVDTFCLGVKDAFFSVRPHEEYEKKINDINQRENLENIHQSCVRKLVEEAVSYAKDLGFNPHPDYRLAKMIFGDIDAGVCPLSFEFGKDGKPLYFAGPYDTPKKSKMIMDKLKKRCGEDGFLFVVPVEDDFTE